MNGDRRSQLRRFGRVYGDLHLAIAWTLTNKASDAEDERPKKVGTTGWQHTTPLRDGDVGTTIFGRGLTNNPAVVLRPSELLAIECDTEDGLARVAALDLPPTVTVCSSKPYKRHFWFRPPPELEQLKFVCFRFEEAGLSADETRYLLVPPAIHPSGASYRFLDGSAPDEVPIATMPAEVYRRLVSEHDRERGGERETLTLDPDAKVREGNRRKTIFRYACQQRRWSADEGEIVEAAMRWNEHHCDPPLTREQVAYQVRGAMKKRGGQELPRNEPPSETPTHVTAAAVIAAVRGYLDIADGEDAFIKAALAVAVSKALSDEEPIWLMEVGASSSGKTEAILLLDGIADKRVDELTRAGLLSWSSGGGKKARKTGILTRIPPVALVTVSDFSTVVTASDREGRARMFGMLRVVYDGHVYRGIGGEPAGAGEELEWEGHLTLVAAATPAVDTHTSFEGALGERWLTLRLPESDAARAVARARYVVDRRDVPEHRGVAQRLATDLIRASRQRIPSELPASLVETLVNLAVFVSHARTGVQYEGVGRHRVILGVPTPEEPTRLIGQLTRFARSALALDLGVDEATALTVKLAMDSVPLARMRALHAVVEAGAEGATVSDVHRALVRGNRWAALWELDALEAIGLVHVEGPSRDEDSSGTRTYRLADAYRGVCESVGPSSLLSPRRGNGETVSPGGTYDFAHSPDEEVERLADLAREAQKDFGGDAL